jgi:hypothetical protein
MAGCSRLQQEKQSNWNIYKNILDFHIVFCYTSIMAKMFVKPKVGKVITVSTFHPFFNTRNTYTGTVCDSAKFDDPQSFRLSTGDGQFPLRVISLDVITALSYDDGSKAEKADKKKIEVNAWQVKSDSRKGGFYTVTRSGDHFACTCVGYGFRRSCRHVLAIKSKVA